MMNSEEQLLEEIFGKQEPMSKEEKYDAIMGEAERIYLRQESVDDPYSFHKAFEWAKKEITEHLEQQKEE